MISSVLTLPFQGRSFSLSCLLQLLAWSKIRGWNHFLSLCHWIPPRTKQILVGSTVLPFLLPSPHPFQSPNFPIYEQGFWKMTWQTQAFYFPHSQQFQKWDLFNPLWIQLRMETSLTNSLIPPAQDTLAIQAFTSILWEGKYVSFSAHRVWFVKHLLGIFPCRSGILKYSGKFRAFSLFSSS